MHGLAIIYLMTLSSPYCQSCHQIKYKEAI